MATKLFFKNKKYIHSERRLYPKAFLFIQSHTSVPQLLTSSNEQRRADEGRIEGGSDEQEVEKDGRK